MRPGSGCTQSIKIDTVWRFDTIRFGEVDVLVA